jgi:type II secretory pathway pseudopilin PulG
MMHRRRFHDTTRTKYLASLAGLGVLACLAAIALMALGVLPRSTGRMIAFLAGAAALVLALLRLLLDIAARRAQEDVIAAPSELTTLTFPPASRFDRPRLPRARAHTT